MSADTVSSPTVRLRQACSALDRRLVNQSQPVRQYSARGLFWILTVWGCLLLALLGPGDLTSAHPPAQDAGQPRSVSADNVRPTGDDPLITPTPVPIRTIDWNAFGTITPVGADADTLRAILANANRYAMTSWWAKAAARTPLDRTRTPTPNPATDPYYLSFHNQPLNYFESGVNVGRATAEALLLAISLKLGAYNEGYTSLPSLNGSTPTTTPVTAATARGRTIRLIESLAIRHRANAAHYGLTAFWGSDPTQAGPSSGADPNAPGAQNAEWSDETAASYVALAAWLLWDDPNFSDAGRDQVRELIIYEADDLLSYDIEWYRDTINNTTAEEMVWGTTILPVAMVMLPTHPHAQQWMRRNLEYMIGAFGRPQDLTPVAGGDPLHGRPVSDWLDRANIFDTGLVHNGTYNPDYQVSLIHTAQSLLAYGFAGEAMPKGALFNADAMYAAIVNHEFHGPDERCSRGPCTPTTTPCPSCSPTATRCPDTFDMPACFRPHGLPTQYSIYDTPVVPPASPSPTATAYPYYIRGSSAIYYPADLWWGWERRAQYALFDALARSDTVSGVPLGLGFDKTATVPAPTWEARHAGEVLTMQQRHLTPSPSTTPDGRIFEICPILNLCLPDPWWAQERAQCESRSDEEETAAYKIAQAYASRWLLDQRKYAQSNLPYEWRELDVGSQYPAPAGGTNEAYGVYTVQAAGTGLGSTSDNLHFVYQPWSGDVEITARIRSFDTAHADARAGIILRDSLAADAPFAMLAFLPADDSFELRVRGSVVATAPAQGRHWMKVTREGPSVQAYITDTPSDAFSWYRIDKVDVPGIGTGAFAGLAVASGVRTILHTAVFDDVHISPHALPIRGAVLANRYNATPSMTPALPGYAADNDPNTSWVAAVTPGVPDANTSAWLLYDLGGNHPISQIGITWPKGGQRQYRFAVQVAVDTTGTRVWNSAIPQLTSTGRGWAEEIYPLPAPLTGRWVRVLGQGWTAVHTATPSPTATPRQPTPTPVTHTPTNTQSPTITPTPNACLAYYSTPTWTALPSATNTPTHSVTPQWVWESSMAAVNVYGLFPSGTSTPYVTPAILASTYNPPHVPEYTRDGDPNTYWSATGLYQWIRYDLGRLRPVEKLIIAWAANAENYHVAVDLSSDGRMWTPGVGRGTQKLTSVEYIFPGVQYARYVRIMGVDDYELQIAEVTIWPETYYPVEWTARSSGATALGNTLWCSAVTATPGWNAGARSVQTVAAGDWYAVARVLDSTRAKMFGLNTGAPTPTYQNLDFALELTDSGTVRVLQRGVLVRAPLPSYSFGAIFRVGFGFPDTTPVVRWNQNAGRLLSYATPLPTPLHVEVGLYDPGAQIADAYLYAPSTTCSVQFIDVPSGSTFYDFVRCLTCRGIVRGYDCLTGTSEPCPGGYFHANSDVTRSQAAKIIALSAGFGEMPTALSFEDVPPNNAFYPFVERLYNRSIIIGYPCGGVGEPCIAPANRPYFRPYNNATRGQLAKIVSAAAVYTETPTGQAFEDVPPGSTFYRYIERLYGRGIVNGYPCGGPGEPCVRPTNRPYFRPNNTSTRGQAAKYIANTFFPSCTDAPASGPENAGKAKVPSPIPIAPLPVPIPTGSPLSVPARSGPVPLTSTPAPPGH